MNYVGNDTEEFLTNNHRWELRSADPSIVGLKGGYEVAHQHVNDKNSGFHSEMYHWRSAKYILI